MQEFQFDRTRNGSLYDRGAADSYYQRPRNPHYWTDGSNRTMITSDQLTKEEIFEYHLGYSENRDFKEY
jgi:hypothetical protein